MSRTVRNFTAVYVRYDYYVPFSVLELSRSFGLALYRFPINAIDDYNNIDEVRR